LTTKPIILHQQPVIHKIFRREIHAHIQKFHNLMLITSGKFRYNLEVHCFAGDQRSCLVRNTFRRSSRRWLN